MEVIKNKFKEQVFVSEAVRYHFNLRSPKSRKPTPIFMVVRVDGKQYKIPTGVKVLPEHWSKKMQVAYVGNGLSLLENSNNLIVNERLDTLIERFSEFLEYLCTVPEQIGNIEILKNHLYMGRSKKVEKTVIQHFKDWCWEKTDSSRPLYQKKVDWLEKYVNTRSDKDTISFSTVATTKFFREFKEWLVANMKARDGGGVKPDTINETVKKIRTLLGKAVELEFITRTAYNDIVIVTLVDKSDANVPFLYNSEVMQLFRYECKDKMDAIAKDVFLLECTTGQRISDVKGLSENVQEGENGLLILDLLTKKESTRVRVRLLFDIARKILIDKYGYDVPYISDAEINKRIKNIAKEAGLNRTWIKTRHSVTDKTGKATENKQPLYKFITTHVGRHTFDCLLKMRGYSYEDIARYAGHNVDMVKRYTDNCTDVDIDNYELTKVNTPENIVKLISEVDTLKEITPIQAQHRLSDMGKILEFVNSKLDAFIAIEQINADTKDFITQNKLDFTWYGGSSFNAYRSKMEKQYKENFEQIISVLDAVMQGMCNAVVKEEKAKPITKAQKTKKHIARLQSIVNEALEIAPTTSFDKIKSETGNDDTLTNEEKDFIISSSEKLRFVAQIIAPTCKVMTTIVESRPIDFFNDYYNRKLDDNLKATWNEVYNGLGAFPKETAVSLLKKAPIATNIFSLIADAYTNNNEKEFVRLFSSCTDDLCQYNKVINCLIGTKQFLDTLADVRNDFDFEEAVSYQIEPMLKEYIGDEDANTYNEKVLDPTLRGIQAIYEMADFLELENKARIEYIRKNIGKDKMTDIDNATNTLMATLMFRVIQNYISMKPLLLRKENLIIEDLLHRDEVFKEFVNVIYEGVISSDKWFSLEDNYFDAKNRQTDGNTYIGEIEGFVVKGGVEKFVSFLNYLGSNGYIEDTPENKTIYAQILTGYGKLPNVPVVEWKKAPNVLGYILSNFYFQGKQFVNAKKLIKINGKLHTATSLTNKNRDFAEFVKELYGLTPEILKGKK